MKKIFSALVIALTLTSVSAIAQSNITWILKEKADNAYFRKTTFNYSISGFNNAAEATSFYAKMKQNPDVLSVEDKGKDAEGNYNATITMKKPMEKSYYLKWISNLGVSYVLTLKGERKTPQQLLTAGTK